MAHGLPILVSKNVGASCYVEHGRNGILFEPTREGICNAVRAVSKPSTRLRMGSASESLVRSNYWIGTLGCSGSVDKQLDDLDKLFAAE
jgi:glycosyltransferase involved in cell wall biosynthesis